MASTSNLFARHTRLVSPIVFFSAVLLLLVGASPWSQAAPTTLSPTTICTNTAVSSLKILGSISNLRKDFCDAEKNYVKVYQTLANNFPLLAGSQPTPDAIAPGPNTTPNCKDPSSFSQTAAPTNTLNTMLSYYTAVFNTIVRGGYLEKMVSFQAQIDKQIDTDNLKFTKEFLTFSTKSANMSKDVDTLAQQLGVEVMTLPSKDKCQDPSKDASMGENLIGQRSWPPTQAEYQPSQVFNYFQSLYNYGTLHAACVTLTSLRDSLTQASSHVCKS